MKTERTPGYDTEHDAEVALRLNGYLRASGGFGFYVKDGHKLQIVRDPGTGKYFIETYK